MPYVLLPAGWGWGEEGGRGDEGMEGLEYGESVKGGRWECRRVPA